ncbi:DUF4367 domain-containing protein [Halalkalibacillus halophilus]|uniref:DUF4367 domain-containing protein n=1 Tax=Halalkalibacillus halophilus TaxID=392827 RepID=UPI00146B41DA|nr:DUF4367 domain-containing protein [Halalkalibacillus halophilus]
MEEHQKNELGEAIEELSFTPEIPREIPFKAKDIEITADRSLFSVKFIGNDQNELTYRSSLAPNTFDFTSEKVEIHKDLEGSYGNDQDHKILRWNNEDIFYELLANSNTTSKEELIKVARNVESY